MPENKKRDNRILAIIILTLISTLSLFLNFRQLNNKKSAETEAINLILALQDTVKIHRMGDSSTRATIGVIESERTELVQELTMKDSTITSLFYEVDKFKGQIKKGGNVTRFRSETDIKSEPRVTVDSNVLFTRRYIDSLTHLRDSLSQAYSDKVDDLNRVVNVSDSGFSTRNGTPRKIVAEDSTKWYKYKFSYNFNTNKSGFNLVVYNEYTAVIGYEKKKPVVTLISDNPYSATKELRAYKVKAPKPKRFGLGLSAGATFNSDFKIRPYIGAGINYNIIEF